MTTKKKNQVFCITLLIIVVMLSVVGCGIKKKTEEEKKKNKDENKSTKVEKIVAKHQEENMKLSVDLFKNSYNPNINVVISPVAIQMSLAYALNGAQGLTQTKLINTVGMETSIYNNYLKTYIEESPKDVRGSVNFVNAIWMNSLNEGMKLKKIYEDRAVEYLNTQIKREPFSLGCEGVINEWISKETDGMITNIIKNAATQNWMFYINAATFSMDWENEYSVKNIEQGEFTNYNNTKASVEMMSSVESISIGDNEVTGFIKNYYNPRYKFVLVMPDDTAKMDQYVANLNESKLTKLLQGTKEEKIKVTLPKFNSVSTVNVKATLIKMGLKDLYSYDADFSGILQDDKLITMPTTIHGASVSIGKKSTEAKVATKVGSVTKDESYSKEIVVDRPFMYLIYDTEESIPLFIGSVKTLG